MYCEELMSSIAFCINKNILKCDSTRIDSNLSKTFGIETNETKPANRNQEFRNKMEQLILENGKLNMLKLYDCLFKGLSTSVLCEHQQ